MKTHFQTIQPIYLCVNEVQLLTMYSGKSIPLRKLKKQKKTESHNSIIILHYPILISINTLFYDEMRQDRMRMRSVWQTKFLDVWF